MTFAPIAVGPRKKNMIILADTKNNKIHRLLLMKKPTNLLHCSNSQFWKHQLFSINPDALFQPIVLMKYKIFQNRYLNNDPAFSPLYFIFSLF